VQIPATRSDAWSFLTHKGFVELIRRWELRLTVADVDLQRFRDVATHIAAQGIAITTFDVERARYGDQLVHELYDLEVASTAGEPRPDQDPETSVSFDRFVSQELHDPRALIDGHFLALDAQRIVGFTRLTRDLAQPRVLEQGFTGVTPEYRGRGIAAALKLHTVRYAQEHGYREIRTANDATNAPMLHINEVLGFRKHTAMIILERRLPARPTGRQSRPGSPTPPTNRSPQG